MDEPERRVTGARPATGRQVSCRCECFVRDLGEESGGSPDTDSWHAGQDWPKRVSKRQSLNFGGDFVALFAQGGELLG